VWNWQLIKKQTGKLAWINFFITVYDTEAQRKNTGYIKPKQTNIVNFFGEYVLVKIFHDLSLWPYDEHNEMRPVIGVWTEDGMDSTHVSSKYSYFHYKCANIDVSLDIKINSYGFMHSLHATTITCILQLSTKADSKLLFTHVYIISKTRVYSSHGA
jgi:hypothetical protein